MHSVLSELIRKDQRELLRSQGTPERATHRGGQVSGGVVRKHLGPRDEEAGVGGGEQRDHRIRCTLITCVEPMSS